MEVAVGSFLNTILKKPLLTKLIEVIGDEDWNKFMKLNWSIISDIIIIIALICVLFLSQDLISKKPQKL